VNAEDSAEKRLERAARRYAAAATYAVFCIGSDFKVDEKLRALCEAALAYAATQRTKTRKGRKGQ
jgi:hypothetical protein